tara:strand:- start:99 stop:317 length:219 start_codon:yes stop_codon:yes gene_type:complete
MITSARHKGEPKEPEYPTLMRSIDMDYIVLMLCPGSGTVLTSGHPTYQIGETVNWQMKCFEVYNGAVTLANV